MSMLINLSKTENKSVVSVKNEIKLGTTVDPTEVKYEEKGCGDPKKEPENRREVEFLNQVIDLYRQEIGDKQLILSCQTLLQLIKTMTGADDVVADVEEEGCIPAIKKKLKGIYLVKNNESFCMKYTDGTNWRRLQEMGISTRSVYV